MTKSVLTDLVIKNLPLPDKGQKVYWDASIPSFGVRVSQGGAKSFVLVEGKRRIYKTIGRHGIISLSDARNEARRILALKTLGHSFSMSQKFGEVFPQFMEMHCARYNKPSTYKSTKRLLEKNCLPLWENKSLHEIDRRDVILCIEQMHRRGSHGAANNLYAAISKFFNWCVSQALLQASPVTSISKPSRTRQLERVLSDNEIAAVWAGASGHPFGTIVRLLLLTACRRSEIATMQHKWLAAEIITIPPEASKNGRQHYLPRTELINSTLKRVKTKSGYLFPARGSKTRPFSGFGNSKKALDNIINIPHWTLHDLRRTAATHIAEMGVAPHVIERILNHVSGEISGVAAVYNRHKYIDEMRDALNLWHEKITRLT